MCNTIGYNETLRNRRYFSGLEATGMLCQSKGEYKVSLLVVTETPSCIQISIKTTEMCIDEVKGKLQTMLQAKRKSTPWPSLSHPSSILDLLHCNAENGYKVKDDIPEQRAESKSTSIEEFLREGRATSVQENSIGRGGKVCWKKSTGAIMGWVKNQIFQSPQIPILE